MRQTVPRLHVITDETLQDRYSHLELAELTVQAGADGVQYREKRDVQMSERLSTAERMNRVCESSNVMLVVNDFVEVALNVNAPAIHLGQEDESIESARKILPRDTVIGGTANAVQDAIELDKLDIDYLGVGPVFGTASKASPAPTLGLAALTEICDACDHPVVAIGNIQVHNVEAVLKTGAHGVAVISGICCAMDVSAATREFCAELGL